MYLKFRDILLELTASQDDNTNPFDRGSILLAVSGGIDSMCMAHLFASIGYSKFAIATVNFSLRGDESDSDEELVKEWAKANNVVCYSTTFDTKEYAKEHGISTQMAARNLRYEWFDSLMKEHSFDFLAIAHNLNDSVETFFINLLRGTGLLGMTGIKRKSGYIIRPMLSFTRREIAHYVKYNSVPFREDSTNAHNDYSRNRLRNMVFPEFEMINQSFLSTLERNMEHVKAAVETLEETVAQNSEQFYDEKRKRVSIERLLRAKRPEFWLYVFLDKYGFNYNQIMQICDSLRGQPGKEFHSDSHLIIKDREWLLLYEKGVDSALESASSTDSQFVELSKVSPITTPFKEKNLKFSIYPKPKGFKFTKKGSIEEGLFGNLFSSQQLPEPMLYLDADKVGTNIEIRGWRDGDRFTPLGMKGVKKISDFLTDIKMDVVSKGDILLILSGGRVVAVLGYRVDDNFKITAQTSNILEVSIL